MIGDLVFLLLIAPLVGAGQVALAVLGVVVALAAVLGFTAWLGRPRSERSVR